MSIRRAVFWIAACAGSLACGGKGTDVENTGTAGTGGLTVATGGAGTGGTGGATGGGVGGTAMGGSGGSATGGVAAGGTGGTAELPPDPICQGAADFVACSLGRICIGGSCEPEGCGSLACNVPAPYFPLPPEARTEFVRTGGTEPIVTDPVTGLVWQGCLAGQNGDTCSEGARSALTYAEAVAYCASLAWGGFDDWVLPDIFALQSMVDYASSPAYDQTAFPGPMPQEVWSSTTSIDGAESLRVVFTSGATGSTAQSFPRSARCVRRPTAPAPLAAPRFERDLGVSGEPVVTDHATGLTWLGCQAGVNGNGCQGGSGVILAYADAEAYCSDLVFGGSSDWRLPNIRELVSVISFAQGAVAFEPMDPNFPYVTVLRSSTPRAGYSGHWMVTYHGVELSSIPDDDVLAVLCVH
jgi:hypothetical protein